MLYMTGHFHFIPEFAWTASSAPFSPVQASTLPVLEIFFVQIIMDENVVSLWNLFHAFMK